MLEVHCVASFFEIFRQLHRHRNAAVLSACAADGNVDVEPPARRVLRQDLAHQAREAREKMLRLVARKQIITHRLVAPGERTQRRLVERIFEKTHIHHNVRIDRDPVFVAEGLDIDLHVLLLRFP